MKKYFQKNFKKCLTSLRTSAIITPSTRLSKTIKTSSFKFNYYGECQSLIGELKKFERFCLKFLQRALIDGRRIISMRAREKKILIKSRFLIWVRFPLISIPLIENVVKRPLTSKTSYQIHIYVYSSRFYCGSLVEIRVVSLSVVCKITVQKQRGSWTSGALPQQPILKNIHQRVNDCDK